ncbi:hypothetical protein F2P81_025580 [Scophthalmus maximus]|uniref:Uncharacterized protein n=1 Tax=Scophthalmus maximus TaxID=52904 RepID=A0A6A4RUD3_SCOMX|nr:hypothetical protein F2P81_025580 [Scophthalmus maximus]
MTSVFAACDETLESASLDEEQSTGYALRILASPPLAHYVTDATHAAALVVLDIAAQSRNYVQREDGPTSKYKDYKQLVCQTCGVKRCMDTRLFKGYSKKDDHGRVIFGNLNRLALKTYGSEDKEVSYKCPSGENVRTAQCQTCQTLKDCLMTLCKECRSSNCEVYAGSTKVSSGKATVARGVYKIDTKASTVNKLKKALEAVKRVATSKRGKGLASAVGDAVINNRETISKLAKVIGLPEDKVATVDQILKVGNGFYMKDTRSPQTRK